MMQANICGGGSTKNLVTICQQLRFTGISLQPPFISTHLSSLKKNVSPVTSLLSARLVLPIILATEQSQNASRYADEQVIVVWASSFQKKDFLPINGETLC